MLKNTRMYDVYVQTRWKTRFVLSTIKDIFNRGVEHTSKLLYHGITYYLFFAWTLSYCLLRQDSLYIVHVNNYMYTQL